MGAAHSLFRAREGGPQDPQAARPMAGPLAGSMEGAGSVPNLHPRGKKKDPAEAGSEKVLAKIRVV